MMLDPSLFLRRFSSLKSCPSFPYLALISLFHCAFKLMAFIIADKIMILECVIALRYKGKGKKMKERTNRKKNAWLSSLCPC